MYSQDKILEIVLFYHKIKNTFSKFNIYEYFNWFYVNSKTLRKDNYILTIIWLSVFIVVLVRIKEKVIDIRSFK